MDVIEARDSPVRNDSAGRWPRPRSRPATRLHPRAAGQHHLRVELVAGLPPRLAVKERLAAPPLHPQESGGPTEARRIPQRHPPRSGDQARVPPPSQPTTVATVSIVMTTFISVTSSTRNPCSSNSATTRPVPSLTQGSSRCCPQAAGVVTGAGHRGRVDLWRTVSAGAAPARSLLPPDGWWRACARSTHPRARPGPSRSAHPRSRHPHNERGRWVQRRRRASSTGRAGAARVVPQLEQAVA